MGDHKIKIFLASSIDEFEKERLQLSDFINTLNCRYSHKGITFTLIKCENMQNALAMERKQLEYNEEIKTCQYFYVLVGEDVGEYTIEEFDVAWQQFQKDGGPKIYTYFQELPSEKTASQRVLDFMDRLDKELGHYYSKFSHIDAVKLNILLEIVRDEQEDDTISAENGILHLGEQQVLSLENVPAFSKNDEIKKLKSKAEDLDARFQKLKSLYSKNREDGQLFEEMMDIDRQRKDTAREIYQVENKVLDLCKTVVAYGKGGTPITGRMKRAAQSLEAGDYDSALAILDDEQRERDLEQTEKTIETAKEGVRGYIADERLKIKILIARGIDESVALEIMQCFDKIVSLSEKYQVDLIVLRDYAQFLFEQKYFEKGIEIAKRLESLWEADNVQGEELADLYCVLANLLQEQNEFKDAKLAYEKEFQIRRTLATKNPDKNATIGLAWNYNNIAALAEKFGEYKEAEQHYQKAIETYKNLPSCDSLKYAYKSALATFCANCGVLLAKHQKYDEAEQMMIEAMKNREKGETQSGQKFLAELYNSLGVLRQWQGRCDEAEEFLYKSLSIYQKLMEKLPKVYKESVWRAYNNLGLLFLQTNNIEKGRESLNKALDIAWDLNEENPCAYAPDLAKSYQSSADFLNFVEEEKENAKISYRKALKIYRKLPTGYDRDKAWACHNLAGILFEEQNHLEAESLFREALGIFSRLVDEGFEQYQEIKQELEDDVEEIRRHPLATLEKYGIQKDKFTEDLAERIQNERFDYIWMTVAQVLSEKGADVQLAYDLTRQIMEKANKACLGQLPSDTLKFLGNAMEEEKDEAKRLKFFYETILGAGINITNADCQVFSTFSATYLKG